MTAPYHTTFFYDRQVRRFLQQFIRIISNFQVEMGLDETGNQVLQQVPVFYGDASRQASQILRNNSENAIKSVPAMAVHISAFNYDRDRVQDPTHVGKLNIRTQAVDPATGLPTGQQGDSFTVERLMPVPYRLTLKVDVWTSNTEQKLMLLEQIMVLFNPAFEIQSTDNYIDWTSLSYVLLTNIDWSNRAVPAGTEETIDIASLTFELPIWISPPAKVKKLGVVQAVINSMYDPNGNLVDFAGAAGHTGDPGLGDFLTQRALTFLNYGVIYQGNTLKLVRKNDISAVEASLSVDSNVKNRLRHTWPAVLDQYGKLKNGTSQIRLKQSGGSEVVGVVALHPTDESLLLFTPHLDTLPGNTLDPINAIINPLNVNVNTHLLNPVTGTRYLLLHAIGSASDTESAPAWNYAGQPELIAQANDIVEFNGKHWVVVFASTTQKNVNSLEYVTNLTTGVQYRWANSEWTKSVEGTYDAGFWRMIL